MMKLGHGNSRHPPPRTDSLARKSAWLTRCTACHSGPSASRGRGGRSLALPTSCGAAALARASRACRRPVHTGDDRRSPTWARQAQSTSAKTRTSSARAGAAQSTSTTRCSATSTRTARRTSYSRAARARRTRRCSSASSMTSSISARCARDRTQLQVGRMGSAPVHPQMGLSWGFLRMVVYISIILDASDIERVDKAR